MVFSYQVLYSVVKKHAKAIFCFKYLATWVQVKIEYIFALPLLNWLNIHLLLPEFRVHNVSYHKSFFFWFIALVWDPWAINPSREKLGSITYSMDQENKVSKIFILSLGSMQWGGEEGIFHFKQTFEFSRLYGEILFFLIAHSIDQSY